MESVSREGASGKRMVGQGQAECPHPYLVADLPHFRRSPSLVCSDTLEVPQHRSSDGALGEIAVGSGRCYSIGLSLTRYLIEEVGAASPPPTPIGWPMLNYSLILASY